MKTVYPPTNTVCGGIIIGNFDETGALKYELKTSQIKFIGISNVYTVSLKISKLCDGTVHSTYHT